MSTPLNAFVWTGKVSRFPDLPAGVARLEALLSPVERARYAGFQRQADRSQFLLAHTMKRLALAKLSGVPARSLEFVADKRGKPHLSGPLGTLAFSMSHGGAAAAVAVASATMIGIDIESCDRHIRQEALLAVMAEQEQVDVAALAKADRGRQIMRLWTAREAMMKALGLGLAMPRSAITFALSDAGPVIAAVDASLGPARDWHLVVRNVSGARILACIVKHRGPVIWHFSSLDDTLDRFAAGLWP